MNNPFKRGKRSLAEEFRAGNEEAFSRVYSRFYKPILRFVSARIYDPAVAEEVTQEVFLKVHRFRETYSAEFAFSTWLWTVARNTVFDHLRGKTEAKVGCELTLAEDIACHRETAEAMTLRKDERKNLFRMARSLTRLQRRVLWLRVVHHLTFAEIAKKLGVSLSAVKNLAHRAKASLTEEFGLVPVFS